MFDERETGGILVACDVGDIDELRELVTATHRIDGVVGYKLGFRLGLTLGLGHARAVIRAISSLPVVYDHQKAGTDIPEMGIGFAVTCRRAGVESAIVFPFGGPTTERAWIQALRGSAVEPVIGALMTHPEFLECEGGFLSDSAPKRAMSIARDEGVRAFVVPGTKLERATSLVQPVGVETRFLVPGIGRQGGTIEDIAAFLPLRQCFPIIGAAIYAAPDPGRAAREFAARYMAAL